jgi:hypothetical protein
MPQICCSFSDELFNEIEKKASIDNTTKPKVVVDLVEQALFRLVPLTEELLLLKEQLGLALQNQRQFQEEILPALKLLTPAPPDPKRTLRERLFGR